MKKCGTRKMTRFDVHKWQVASCKKAEIQLICQLKQPLLSFTNEIHFHTTFAAAYTTILYIFISILFNWTGLEMALPSFPSSVGWERDLNLRPRSSLLPIRLGWTTSHKYFSLRLCLNSVISFYKNSINLKQI